MPAHRRPPTRLLSARPRALLAAACCLIWLTACGTTAPPPVITPRPAATLPPTATAEALPAVETPRPTPEPTMTPAPAPTATASPTLVPDPLELVRRFPAGRAQAYVEELAGARYAGRRAGTAGGDAAADYIAAEFARLGLLPAGDDDTYLQRFSIPFVDLAEPPELALLPGSTASATTYVHMQDFREVVAGRAGAGRVAAEVIYLAGGYDSDYAAVDVRDRIVLLDAARRPGTTLPAIESALTRGAAAVLIVAVDDDSVRLRPSYGVSPTQDTRPVLFVNHRVAGDLAAAAGVTLDERPRALGVQARLSVTLQPARTADTANVLGLWPGSDPALRDRVLLIGGHYDHVGQPPSGVLYPGANDNASGIGVMLALAQGWVDTGYRPSMTVLFVAWSAEEAGLLGSRHYTAQPARPLPDTIAFLNLDVVGAGSGEGLVVGYGDQGLATQLVTAALALGHPLAAEAMGASDHTSFTAVGVPAVMLSAAGSLDTLHRPEDTPERIEPENLAQAGQISWLTVLYLGGTWAP